MWLSTSDSPLQPLKQKKMTTKDILRKVYEDGKVYANRVPFETYYKDESKIIELCIRDRDLNGIEND